VRDRPLRAADRAGDTAAGSQPAAPGDDEADAGGRDGRRGQRSRRLERDRRQGQGGRRLADRNKRTERRPPGKRDRDAKQVGRSRIDEPADRHGHRADDHSRQDERDGGQVREGRHEGDAPEGEEDDR
jgi:hypothetical protein